MGGLTWVLVYVLLVILVLSVRVDISETPKGRTGLLRGTAKGAGLFDQGTRRREYNWVAEVEEVDSIGELSKLKFNNVSGVDKDSLLDILPEWVKTSDVIWRED